MTVVRMWQVVGGADSGGILVREDESTNSAKLPAKLAHGSVISELQLAGNRLFYLRVSGDGPDRGWVSVDLHGKALCSELRVSAVLFDLFGTLLHMRARRLPWSRLFGAVQARAAELGLSGFDEAAARLYVQVVDGLPTAVAQEAVAAQLPAFSGEQVQQLCTEQDFEGSVQAEAASIELFEDTLETLGRLRRQGLKLALVSNLATPYACALDGIRELFDTVVLSFAEGVAKGQPGDDRIYTRTAERLGVPIAECLFVGDTVDADYEGPVAAGMQAVHLDRRRRTHAVACRPTIATLAELDFAQLGGVETAKGQP